jgi:hypothetical protein
MKQDELRFLVPSPHRVSVSFKRSWERWLSNSHENCPRERLDKGAMNMYLGHSVQEKAGLIRVFISPVPEEMLHVHILILEIIHVIAVSGPRI